MHDRARLGASWKIFCGACTDAVEHAGIDGEAPLLSCGDPRTCLRISIAEAGPGASEPGVRARAEATAAPAPVAHTAARRQLGSSSSPSTCSPAVLASSWRLMASSSPWSRARSARAERRRRHAAWAREGPYVCRVWECTTAGECTREFAYEWLLKCVFDLVR